MGDTQVLPPPIPRERGVRDPDEPDWLRALSKDGLVAILLCGCGERCRLSLKDLGDPSLEEGCCAPLSKMLFFNICHFWGWKDSHSQLN